MTLYTEQDAQRQIQDIITDSQFSTFEQFRDTGCEMMAKAFTLLASQMKVHPMLVSYREFKNS